MARKVLWAALVLAFLCEPARANDNQCPKEDVAQGGLDSSLPCHFHSPLPWEAHRVMFGRNSGDLDAEAKAVLDRQAEILRGYPGLALTIWGHVDHEEARRANGKALGFQRANAVRDYLILRGVAPERITTDSRGDRAMIVKGRTEGALAVMRYATTETEDNPRSPK